MFTYQLNLLDPDTEAATATRKRTLTAVGFVADMKAALRQGVGQSGLSRDQVVDAMNDIARLLGRPLCKGNTNELSVSTLEKWLADEQRGQMPGMFATHVFMLATKSTAPLEVWLGMFDCSLLDAKGKDTLEYAKVTLHEKAIKERKVQLEKKLLGGRHGYR